MEHPVQPVNPGGTSLKKQQQINILPPLSLTGLNMFTQLDDDNCLLTPPPPQQKQKNTTKTQEGAPVKEARVARFGLMGKCLQ